MIVTCDECSTSFKLDESRLPASGAQVRCSKCKHAFFLPHPSADAVDAADEIAAQVARDAAAGVPRPSTDLAGLDGSIASEANPVEPGADHEEEDWQFSEEVRNEGDELDQADGFGGEADFSAALDDEASPISTPSPDPSSDSSDYATDDESIALDVDDASSGLEIADDAVSIADDLDEIATDAAEIGMLDGSGDDHGIEAGHDDSGFGVVEDFSALDEEASIDIGVPDIGVEPQHEPDPASALAGLGEPAEDLGDPESWDLTPDADFDSSKTSITGLVEAFTPRPSQAPGLVGNSVVDDSIDPSEFDADILSGSRISGFLSIAANAVGWLVTAVAIGFVASASFAPEWQRWIVSNQTFTSGAFQAETTNIRWLDTARLGSILVVDGVIQNTDGRSARPPVLQVALLDAEGAVIAERGAPIANPLSELILREGTSQQLTESTAEAVARFRARTIDPGEKRPFQTILTGSIDGARRFVLQEAPIAALASVTPAAAAVDSDSAHLQADETEAIGSDPGRESAGLQAGSTTSADVTDTSPDSLRALPGELPARPDVTPNESAPVARQESEESP